jgi:two-component system, chemotaxis family, sensor kinase CheA
MSAGDENRIYIEVFIEESNENLSDIENELIAIERSGADINENRVNKVFRAAHTIKGSAGFFDLTNIKELAHKTESVLDLIRSRKIVPMPDVVNILLLSFDRLKEMINAYETSNDADISDLLSTLETIITKSADKKKQKADDLPAQDFKPAEKEEHTQPETEPAESKHDHEETPALKDAGIEQVPDVPAQSGIYEKVAEESSEDHAETTLRVQVDLLENLMNLAGELVLGRNQLLEAIKTGDSRSIGISGQKINLVTSELQETIMLTRMQPIRNVFNRFPRVVRDLARKMNKEVKLVVAGKEVELDKTIIEGLADPLTHMVRNAVDHGIEDPSERIHQGKIASGSISLKAYHEAGHVIIEVSDDGKGIDTEGLSAKAVSMGTITQEQTKLLSEKEKLNLMFLPGLTTSKTVTDLSGRGVGMDVVKNGIDRLGGKIDIISQPGKGSVFRIKLPLTLAIIPCLLVYAGDESFAIPQINVDELIRIKASHVKDQIEVIGTSEALNLRSKIIPVIRLSEVLGIETNYTDPEDTEIKPDRRDGIAERRSKRYPLFDTIDDTSSVEEPDVEKRRSTIDRRERAQSDLNIVIISTGAFQYGLVVENLHDTVEIVAKPLGRYLKHLKEYAGITIMGDGTIALILDAAGIAASANLTSFAGSTRQKELEEQSNKEKCRESKSYLVFFNSPSEQCAVPLDTVMRIERVEAGMIEKTGGRKTMKYRNATLPLFSLNDAVDIGSMPDREDYVVIVFDFGGRQTGLIASPPVDIAEVTSLLDRSTLRQKGITGSSIIRSATTLIVDMAEIVATVHPEWGVTVPSGASQGKTSEITIIVAEDSDFFRAQISHLIESKGYNVIAAVDGQAAWELFEQQGERFNLGVFDIEMPRMNGVELTKKVRTDTRFSRMPIIALSALADDEDIQNAINAGVTEYQIKLDKERLLESIAFHIKNSE